MDLGPKAFKVEDVSMSCSGNEQASVSGGIRDGTSLGLETRLGISSKPCQVCVCVGARASVELYAGRGRPGRASPEAVLDETVLRVLGERVPFRAEECAHVLGGSHEGHAGGLRPNVESAFIHVSFSTRERESISVSRVSSLRCGHDGEFKRTLAARVLLKKRRSVKHSR